MLVRERCWCLYENGLVTVSRQGDTSAADSRTFTFKGCETGSYTFRLLTAIGDSELARVTVRVNEAVTPKAPAPTGLRATVNSTSSIALSWNAVANAHRYRLERAATSSGPWTVVGDELATTTRAATGLACGTTYQFRVSARGDGAPYDSKWGAPSSSLAAGTPCVSASVASGDLFVGQSAALTASVTGAPSGVSYRWQKWGNGAWTNLAATSTTHSVSSATTSVGFFRFAVNYPSGGGSAASGVLAVQWRPMSVSVSASPEFPLSASSTMRTVTLTATSTAPSGVSYQWQQGAGGGWTDLGAKTTSLTKDVSFTTRGTRKFRVVVSHATASSATSSPVYVTWDEGAIVGEMMGKLSSTVASSTTYSSIETALLNCIERRTGTRPSSLTAVMSQYKGAQKTAADECDERGAVASSTGQLPLSPTRTFNNLHELFKTTLATIKNGNSVYADYLDTPQGRDFSKNVASPRLVKSTAAIVSSLVAGPVATSTDQATGQVPTPPNIPRSRPSITDCLKHVPTPREKVNVLNCLIFHTDFEDWVTLKKNDDDGSEFETLLNSYGLDEGDYRCSDGKILWGRHYGPTTTVREEAACIRHDVAWNSLQEFVKDPKGSNSEHHIDSAWHPRNKFLADALVFIEWKCAEHAGLKRLQCFSRNPDFWVLVGTSGVDSHRWRTAFIVHRNSFGWPITYQDLDHARENPRYVICKNPVPRVSDPKLVRNGTRFVASWDFQPGCAVGLDDVRFKLEWRESRTLTYPRLGVTFDTGVHRPRTADVLPASSCSTASTTTSCTFTFDDGIVWAKGSSVSLYIYVPQKIAGHSRYPEVRSVPAPNN